ncbi:MAG: 2-oxoacid:ferredoxin oxidoreductase subunit gamma [Candidatus Omnitrophica bacterium]|nr:2-oxoacid:ferredoxin oxidoreductase subunit gamma [Candidatus Omnitrophota bacterium]
MTEKVIIAGSGGQGIMLLGKVLAESAMEEGKFVTWLPAYGAEVRGGTAHCMVVISDEEIGSPYIDKADTLIIMNQPSLTKFKSRLDKNGLLIANSSLTTLKENNPRLRKYPFTDIAVKIGNIKVANMIALGCYLKIRKAVKTDSVSSVIKKMAPKGREDLIKINQEALEEGIRLTNG